MSVRRIPPPRNAPAPALRSDGTPAVSGEYRITSPGRYSMVERQCAAAAPSCRMLDDDLEFEFDVDADGALELPLAAPGARTPSRDMLLPAAPRWPTASSQRRRSSSKMHAVRTSSSTMAAVDTHAALVAFAGFGDPPVGLWGTPAYAARVIVRRRALRKDLERARHHRSQDVGLYEASLRTADDGAVRNGLLLLGTLSFLAIVVVVALAQVISNVLSAGG